MSSARGESPSRYDARSGVRNIVGGVFDLGDVFVEIKVLLQLDEGDVVFERIGSVARVVDHPQSVNSPRSLLDLAVVSCADDDAFERSF